MTCLRNWLAVALLLVACAAEAAGQSAASISGTVSDQSGAVIAGAAVRLISTTGGQVLLTATDSDGRYRVAGLRAGAYRISASGDGFSTAARAVSVGEAENVTLDFSLAPGAITDAITVTAGKGNPRASIDTPQMVTVAGAQEVEKQRPASTLEALERTPNLTQVGSNPAAERPRFRGLSSNRVLIIIDGERLNNFRSDPLSGVSPGVIDVTGLESIEAVAGAGSSLHGSDAMAGTINLITRAPARTEARQQLAIKLDGDLRGNGLFRRGAAAVTWSEPRLALRLSGSLFAAGNYHAGDEAISIDEVVRLGRFAVEAGELAGSNVARTYAVWALPGGAEIPNGRARGFNDQVDLWAFLTANHSLRYRQLNSQHKGIQFPFITPPFDGREQSNGFRRLDKHGLRYEGQEIAGWLSHASAGFYRQKYSFADDNFVSTINAGSSWSIVQSPDSPAGVASILTGDTSTFTLGSFTDGKSSVTSYGLDAQATFITFGGAALTTGLAYLRDFSRDDFSRVEFKAGAGEAGQVTSGRAANPDSVYKNVGWFNLIEHEPVGWLRLVGGFRVDSWKTEARVTQGFPIGTEAAILDASFNQLAASPGQIDIDGLKGIARLVGSAGAISTSNTIVTGNAGAVVRLPGRVNPFFRWGTSYREPGITERYSLRNFGDPTFSVLLAANAGLRPERGRSFDFGVKARRDRWNFALSYFRNDFRDFLKNSFSNVLFVPADPSRGLEPLSPELPFHGVLYVQRTNTARARIEGVEGDYAASLSLKDVGTVTLFGSLGWLRGADLTPDATALALIDRFYNRPDTPVRLEGSPDDVPLGGITPFRGVFGASYASREGRWFADYRVRYQSRVSRVDPLDISTTIITQYGTLASLGSFAKHSVRGGYTHRGESYRVTFAAGVDNLSDRLYFEHFQSAPAAGRSLVFGVTTDFWNLLRR